MSRLVCPEQLIENYALDLVAGGHQTDIEQARIIARRVLTGVIEADEDER